MQRWDGTDHMRVLIVVVLRLGTDTRAIVRSKS
jgi:hypothetical protein